MKTVLLLAYCYPPAIRPSSKRPGCMAKYLPHYGWRPLVISRLWRQQDWPCDPNFVTGLPAEALVAAIPDDSKGDIYAGLMPRILMFLHPSTYPPVWTRRALHVLPRIFAEYGIDAIWATSGPHGSHHLADFCSKRWGIPWIADFRDVDGQNGSQVRLRDMILHLRALPFEKRTVCSASAITTVSEGLGEMLQARYEQEVCVIPNGFDPDDYTQADERKCDTFTIAYFGSVYAYLDPRPLFAALDRLQSCHRMDPKDIRIQFYGPSFRHIASMAKSYHCSQMVECYEPIPHSQVVRLQREAAVLLVLACPGGKGILTSKIFEYLAARRPILSIPTDRTIDPLLRETNSGVSGSTPQQIAEQLQKWYREWKATGTIGCLSKEEMIEKYSRKKQAEELGRLLDRVATTKNGRRSIIRS